MAFRIQYARAAKDHLQALTARKRAAVVEEVDIQLMHQPTVETRNRKTLRPNPIAPFELRVGNLRVYYEVQEEPEPVVSVVGIGVKIRNRVWLGGEEVSFS